VTPVVKPVRPSSPDEEILAAEQEAVLSLLDDEGRIEAVSAELRRGFAAMAALGPAVTIFGSARTPEDNPEYDRARELGRRLGEAGFPIITGGGPGAMEAANFGAQQADVHSVGLGIELPHEEHFNRYADVPLLFHYFFTRKVMFVRYACAFVCLPGGFGTLDELFEVLTLRQTGKIRKRPVILLGSDYWGGLVEWLTDRVRAEGKIDAIDVDEIMVTDELDEVVRTIIAAAPARS
jgi:uncharacterized protein (TIGR00730 family)